MTDTPFDDVRDLIARMPDLELPSEYNADGSLQQSKFGRLTRIGKWLSASQRKDIAQVENTTLALFAGSHGLAKYQVSVSEENATQRRIDQLRNGTLATNGVAADARSTVKVFELALEKPTGDISVEPAMSEQYSPSNSWNAPWNAGDGFSASSSPRSESACVLLSRLEL